MKQRWYWIAGILLFLGLAAGWQFAVVSANAALVEEMIYHGRVQSTGRMGLGWSSQWLQRLGLPYGLCNEWDRLVSAWPQPVDVWLLSVDTPVPDEAYERWLHTFQNIQCLGFESVVVTPAQAETAAKMPHLTRLWVLRTNQDDRVMATLLSAPKLVNVQIDIPHVSSAVLQSLAKVAPLHMFKMETSGVNAASLSQFAETYTASHTPTNARLREIILNVPPEDYSAAMIVPLLKLDSLQGVSIADQRGWAAFDRYGCATCQLPPAGRFVSMQDRDGKRYVRCVDRGLGKELLAELGSFSKGGELTIEDPLLGDEQLEALIDSHQRQLEETGEGFTLLRISAALSKAMLDRLVSLPHVLYLELYHSFEPNAPPVHMDINHQYKTVQLPKDAPASARAYFEQRGYHIWQNPQTGP